MNKVLKIVALALCFFGAFCVAYMYDYRDVVHYTMAYISAVVCVWHICTEQSVSMKMVVISCICLINFVASGVHLAGYEHTLLFVDVIIFRILNAALIITYFLIALSGIYSFDETPAA